MKVLVAIALLACLTTSSMAWADEQPKKDQNGSDRLICRSEPVLGSRIAKQKRCLTAAQWEENRQNQRMAIERSQSVRYKNN